VAQEPVHLEVVEVSGANQYKVRPAEFVSTFLPPMVVVDSAPPAAAAAALGVAEPPLPAPVAAGVPELPQAATVSATAAGPAVLNIFRMCELPHSAKRLLLGITYAPPIPFINR
jgi:hypothetical protein